MYGASAPPIDVKGGQTAAPPFDVKGGRRASPQERQQKLFMSTVRAVAIVAFFGAINLFSWNGRIWFQWPSLVVLLVFILRTTRIYRQQADKESSKR
jgi:hypothetical protein